MKIGTSKSKAQKPKYLSFLLDFCLAFFVEVAGCVEDIAFFVEVVGCFEGIAFFVKVAGCEEFIAFFVEVVGCFEGIAFFVEVAGCVEDNIVIGWVEEIGFSVVVKDGVFR